MLSEGALQMSQIDQELFAQDPDVLAFGIEPGTGNQAVNMGMELQSLVPGMQGGGKAADDGAQSLIIGQLFSQGRRDGGEEQVVGLFSERPKETTAQLRWKSESDQEVGRVDKFMK